jgi:hypothetical protein
VNARKTGGSPDDDVISAKTTLEAIATLQKKVLKQDEQIAALQADVLALRRASEEGE